MGIVPKQTNKQKEGKKGGRDEGEEGRKKGRHVSYNHLKIKMPQWTKYNFGSEFRCLTLENYLSFKYL